VFNLTSYVVTPYGGSASTTNFTVNAMNEYTAVGGVTHLYHDNGSLKDDGTYTYKYDSHDHLVEVRLKSNGSLVAEYFYDAVGGGRRVKKVVGNDTTRFVYQDLHCVEEYDGSGDLLRLFAFGDRIDQVVMMEAPDIADVNDNQSTSEVLRFHYHTQLVGSVTHVTGPDEGVVESYEYEPYGATTIKDQGGSTVSTSPIGNPFMYTGRRLDEETGLYYYRACHYSPTLKRFVQRDPLEYVDGPNAHAYTGARPTRNIDPLGLSAIGQQSRQLGTAFGYQLTQTGLVQGTVPPRGLGDWITPPREILVLDPPGWWPECGTSDEGIDKDPCDHVWEEFDGSYGTPLDPKVQVGTRKGTTAPQHSQKGVMSFETMMTVISAMLESYSKASVSAGVKVFGTGAEIEAGLKLAFGTGSASEVGTTYYTNVYTHTEVSVTSVDTTTTPRYEVEVWERCTLCPAIRKSDRTAVRERASTTVTEDSLSVIAAGTYPVEVHTPISTTEKKK
jgi:RHS repeat-associated protein